MKTMGHSLLALENRLQAEGASTRTGEEQQQQQQEGQQVANLTNINGKTSIGNENANDDNDNETFIKGRRDEPSKLNCRLALMETDAVGAVGGLINLITDRQLDMEEKKVIYELTMKKRQSKKSTMSEKQLLAKQQLAKELKLERRDPIDIDSIRYATLNTTLNRSYSMILSNDDLHDRASSSGSGSFNGSDVKELSLNGISKSHPKLSLSTCSCGCCISFNGSDKSYGASSSSQQDSSQQQQQLLLNDNNDCCLVVGLTHSELELEEIMSQKKKEATIRVKRSRLEQLNAELETRLYQYEYLVAQEKALLGSYNMMLFANKGVNNFNSRTQDLL